MTNTSYFENIQSIILKELDETNNQVTIAVSWLTDPVLFHKLYALCRKGKKVELLLNYDQINLTSRLEYEKLTEAGGKIFWEYESDQRLMHNKYCIIDTETIITGSYNWTKKAHRNNENIIVIKEDYENIAKYRNEFYRLTNQKNLIITETFSPPKYNTNDLSNYKSFLDWWENGFIELRILISERVFNKKYNFYSLPSENDYQLLLSTTALDLEFAGNLLLDYKEAIQKHFNDYDSLQSQYGYNISGLKGIENLRNLEYLNCSWNDIVELEPLCYLKNLTYLDLSNNGRLQTVIFDVEMDLTPLKHLSNLQYLNLSANTFLKNFESLYYLKDLRTLDLSGTNASETDIESIKKQLSECDILTNSIVKMDFDIDEFDSPKLNNTFDDLPF